MNEDEIDEDEVEFAFHPIFSLNTYPRLRGGGYPVVEIVNSNTEVKLQELSSILDVITKEYTHLSDIYRAMHSNITRVLKFYNQLRLVWLFSVFRMLLMAAYIIYDFMSYERVIIDTGSRGIGFFMVIVFIYEIAYRRALYAKEYHSFQADITKNNKHLNDLITMLDITNRKLLLISGHKFSELKESRHWAPLHEEPDYSSAAWRAGESERHQFTKGTASSNGNHSLIGYLTGIIFAFFGNAIVGFTVGGALETIGILGAIIGFMAGRIVGDLLAQSRIGRYIFGAIVVIFVLYILLLIVAWNVGFPI